MNRSPGADTDVGPNPQRVFHSMPICLIVVLCAWALAGIGSLHAQDSAEARAFAAAARAFQDGVFERAEQEFGAFAKEFPQSSRRAEAILLQARSALRLQRREVALHLLNEHGATAGTLADEFRYWLAETHTQGSNFTAAAETFASLSRDFTNSARLLEASYGEALARYRLGEWRQVTQLLQSTNGTFRRAVAARSSDELTVRGQFLLAEALLEQREYGQAEKAAGELVEADLLPEFRWRRQHLLTRIRSVAQRPREALEGIPHLLELAAATGQPGLPAESVALHGEVLKQLGEFEAAARVFGQNVSNAVAPEIRRGALLALIELNLAQNKIADAAQQLESFLAKYPEEAGSDVALLTLGELHLKAYFAPPTSSVRTNGAGTISTNGAVIATNALRLARTQFDALVKQHTNSSWRGKAWLNLGWCAWEENQFAESLGAFANAGAALPFGEDLAVARFKLADAQFRLNDLSNAVTNYRAVIEQFESLPRVRASLFAYALYQIVRASIERGDAPTATQALRQILDQYAESGYGDRSLLLLGQNLAREGQPAAARELFAEFNKRFPQSSLRPELELAVARTYAREGEWAAAAARHEQWLEQFPTNALRAQAEFDGAWAYHQAGRSSNAFMLFTNFVVQFATHELAPAAQYWIGDYYLGVNDTVNAQKNFQLVFENTNWPPSTLSYQARLMAGRAAYAGQRWNDAIGGERGHFTLLINDTNCPPDIVAAALFGFGDTLTRQPPDAANPVAHFDKAKLPFRKITELFPTNALTPLAWGRIGDCFFQMAGTDPKFYADATESYQKVVTNLQAGVSARAQAQFGLGQVAERQARLAIDNTNAATDLLKTAFDRYYDIVSGKLLQDGESADTFWVKEASLAAARLAEDRRQWDVAANLYTRLRTLLPPLRAALDKKIERATEQARLERN